ncbi:MAG: NUDIX domain-containing protein [Bacteroidales bacterium]|nr:NUDIX domain-containing protein [Bacteroidales bacterium]
MRRIYFQKRCISICSYLTEQNVLADPNAVQYVGKFDIAALVEMFENSESLRHIYIPVADEEATFREICSNFKEVNAAGGLISNRRGDFLLIQRTGMWDLPKGHQEEGEDIRETAVREVSEETGLGEIIPGDLICITNHCYIRDGIWHLKHTYWYNMLYNAPTELVPQREEDISVAAWVAKSSLPSFLTNTFPSIAEVFKEAKV